MRNHASRTYRLKDRRIMEYAEYGDPRGTPMFFLHGLFGSRHQASLPHDVAVREGIRIIAPNRPGVGRSSPARFATMIDYADDIRQLADHLGIPSFAVVGASGGGPFALACAYAMPERVRLTGVFGGLGPLHIVRHLQQMHWFRRFFLSGCHGYPITTGLVFQFFFRLCRNAPRWFFRLMIRSSTAMAEENVMQRREVQRMLWNDYQEVFLQKNGAEALLLEIYLYFHWGFDPGRLPAETRAFFWHGKKDKIAPWPTIREISGSIHRAETIPCSGGHITFMLEKLDSIFIRLREEWNIHELRPITA